MVKKVVGKPECVQFRYEVISLNPKEVSVVFQKINGLQYWDMVLD